MLVSELGCRQQDSINFVQYQQLTLCTLPVV